MCCNILNCTKTNKNGREIFQRRLLSPTQPYLSTKKTRPDKPVQIKTNLSLNVFNPNVCPGGQCSSLAAHWLSIPGDRGSNYGGKEHFPLWFLTHNLMITVYIQKIN